MKKYIDWAKHLMDGMESRSDPVEDGITELEDKAEDILTICHREKGVGNVKREVELWDLLTHTQG